MAATAFAKPMTNFRRAQTRCSDSVATLAVTAGLNQPMSSIQAHPGPPLRTAQVPTMKLPRIVRTRNVLKCLRIQKIRKTRTTLQSHRSRSFFITRLLLQAPGDAARVATAPTHLKISIALMASSLYTVHEQSARIEHIQVP